jgi:integrase
MASVVRYKDRWRALVRTKDASQSRVFDTKRDALVWARAVEGSIAQPKSAITFGKVLDVYVEEARRATGKSRDNAIAQLRARLADVRLNELDTRAFIGYAKLRGRGPERVSAATIGTELTYAGTALKFSGGFLDAVPECMVALGHLAAARKTLATMDLVSSSAERDRRPTDVELWKLRTYCLSSQRLRAPIWDMICFAIATAMRLGEITRINWSDVDETERLVTVRDRKHPSKKIGNHSVVPLLNGPTVVLGEPIDPLEIMRRTTPHKRGRVFPYAATSVSHTFADISGRLRIDDLTFHDLRHESISRLFEYGYAIQQVAIVSGHKSWKHLRRYTNIKPASLHEATRMK